MTQCLVIVNTSEAGHGTGASLDGLVRARIRVPPDRERVCPVPAFGIRGPGFHLQTLIIYKLSFNQNYYMFTLIFLIEIVMSSKYPCTELIIYKCLNMRFGLRRALPAAPHIHRSYVTKSGHEVVLHKSIPPQIRQLVLDRY